MGANACRFVIYSRVQPECGRRWNSKKHECSIWERSHPVVLKNDPVAWYIPLRGSHWRKTVPDEVF
jgi:hypothetical protein